MASVVAVCISERKGTQKHQVPEIRLKTDNHRFHLCPSNCHCKSKGRRCQSRRVCRQKRQAQEKESMMLRSQKIRIFCKRVF